MKIEKYVSRALVALFFTVGILYGGSKHAVPPSTTNTPPASARRVLRAAGRQEACLAQVPAWTARGAFCDWKRIEFPEGFRFPCGTNYLDSATVVSWGGVRADLSQPELASLPRPVSLEPGVSSFGYGLTPSNSLVFAWQNACVERSATNRTNAAVGLFASGEVVTTFGGETGRVAPQPPEGFVGRGQDEAWIRAAFPEDADRILATGYAAWLADWVGVDAQNGRYQAAVTIAAMPEDGAPVYLVCGPYRVNVTAPGTYRFPLEVFETYETRTYPAALPLSVEYDDGYTGGRESFEMVDMRGNAALSRSGARTANWFETEYDNIIRNMMQPKVVVTPEVVPLSTAVGTRVSFWCNMTNVIARSYHSFARETRLMFRGDNEAELQAADDEDAVEFWLESLKGQSHGIFYIERDMPPSNDYDGGTNTLERTQETVFSGEWYHVETIGEHRAIYLTVKTMPETTETVYSTTTVGLPSGLSAFVGAYLATTESGLDEYNDGALWSVMTNGVTVLNGETTVSAHAYDMCRGSIYGVSDGAVFLGGTVLQPPADGILTMRLFASAWNVDDGKKETCVQIVVCPIDSDNVYGKPEWTP